MIFPNLFIAEIQMFVIQPLAADDSVQHVTALQFKGAPDMNRRLRQQTMGSVGPAGLLLAMIRRCTNAVIGGAGAQSRMDIPGSRRASRRMRRGGYKIGHVTDEVPSRGIWRHYRSLMEQGDAVARKQRHADERRVRFPLYGGAIPGRASIPCLEALWTDDGIYWVPATGPTLIPKRRCRSFTTIARDSLRIKQLLTGKRHTQTPQSRLRRIVSNIGLMGEHNGDIAVTSTAWCSSPACATIRSGRAQRISAALRRWRVANGLQESHAGQQ